VCEAQLFGSVKIRRYVGVAAFVHEGAERELDASLDPRDEQMHMADVIDLTLVADARRFFFKLLDARGLSYFLRKDGQRLFHIEQSKVEMVVRTAARNRPSHLPKPPLPAVDYCRREIRRELIRRVVQTMLQTGF
jgi:hypothetical protein